MTLHPKASGTVPSPWRLARFIGVLCAGMLALGGATWLTTAETAFPPPTPPKASKPHWAYQPLGPATPPSVLATDRLATPVDAFIQASVEARGQSLAPPVDSRTWLRRVSLDLIGLPPTFEQIQRFQAEDSTATRARVIDELLANPRYGERWGRHWLDVARYADTKDLVLLYGRDALRPFAYTYRDYVIRAFNDDLPFDEFIRDQIAADLATPPVEPWRLAAMGFLTLGRLFDNNRHDQIDDQIDTVSRGFLGLTVACARCHDHKYDAISMADYYGLYGVFASTERPHVMPLIEDPESVPGGPAFETRLAQARKELEDHMDTEYAKWSGLFLQRFGDYLLRAATTEPDFAETAQFFLSLTPDDFRPAIMLRTRRLLGQRSRPDDPVFGPWHQLMGLPDSAFAEGRGRLEIPAGTTWNPRVVDALQHASLTNRSEVAAVYGRLFLEVHGKSSLSTHTPSPPALRPEERELLAVVEGAGSPVVFPRRETPDYMSRPDKDRYGGLVLNLDKLAAHATSRPPARAMVVVDLPEPQTPRIFLRGSPSRPGPQVSRGFLRVLNGGRELTFRSGSGRAELAEAIVSTNNPLTARVFVNRVWMHHFGEPLVSSPTDFGVRGDPPLHPELLDWLAGEFIRSGWSVKHLHRVILRSATFAQQAGDGYPRRRLDLEAMRDSLLAVSGRLETAFGGPPSDMAGNPLAVRRTVYGLVDRQNLPGLFRSFDFATPDQCAERRPQTTVPQQALFALNSPFVQEQARSVVGLPEVAQAPGAVERLQALYRRILARNPSSRELGQGLQFLEATPRREGELDPWEQLAQVLMISNEAVFID